MCVEAVPGVDTGLTCVIPLLHGCADGLPSLCGWCPFKAATKSKGHCVSIANRDADNKLCPITNNTILLQYVAWS